MDDTLVVWEKFECDAGCRWVQVKGTLLNTRHDGDRCDYSGCDGQHLIHKRGETSDRQEAKDWFWNAHEGAKNVCA